MGEIVGKRLLSILQILSLYTYASDGDYRYAGMILSQLDEALIAAACVVARATMKNSKDIGFLIAAQETLVVQLLPQGETVVSVLEKLVNRLDEHWKEVSDGEGCPLERINDPAVVATRESLRAVELFKNLLQKNSKGRE